MKKSRVIITSCICATALFSISCGKSNAVANGPTPENGAQFKDGQGLSLTGEMKKAIGFKTAEVTEENIRSAIKLEFIAVTGNEARAPLTPQQGSSIRPGMEITLTSDSGSPAMKGIVRQIEKIPFAAPGDLEAIISTGDSLAPGKSYQGTIDLPASGPVPAVPTSALLKTAEGTFVYAVNGSAYVRTPVKTGVINDQLVEISDGLYSGDEIVTTPVMSLWMAELQVLRGGKACTCGH